MVQIQEILSKLRSFGLNRIIESKRRIKKLYSNGKSNKEGCFKRHFIGTAAIGVAGVAMFSSLSACKQKAGDKKLKLGFIGMGRQSMFLLSGFISIPGIRVVAGCDVYGVKRKRFEKRVNNFYKRAQIEVEVQTYEKFEDYWLAPILMQL